MIGIYLIRKKKKKNFFRGRAPGKMHPLPMCAFMCTRLKTCTLNTIHGVLKMRNFRSLACVGIKRLKAYGVLYIVYIMLVYVLYVLYRTSLLSRIGDYR